MRWFLATCQHNIADPKPKPTTCQVCFRYLGTSVQHQTAESAEYFGRRKGKKSLPSFGLSPTGLPGQIWTPEIFLGPCSIRVCEWCGSGTPLSYFPSNLLLQTCHPHSQRRKVTTPRTLPRCRCGCIPDPDTYVSRQMDTYIPRSRSRSGSRSRCNNNIYKVCGGRTQ